MKTTIESDYESLLTEMRRARAYGVPEIGAREIADEERKLERIRHNLEGMRVVASMFLDSLARGKSRLPKNVRRNQFNAFFMLSAASPIK